MDNGNIWYQAESPRHIPFGNEGHAKIAGSGYLALPTDAVMKLIKLHTIHAANSKTRAAIDTKQPESEALLQKEAETCKQMVYVLAKKLVKM